MRNVIQMMAEIAMIGLRRVISVPNANLILEFSGLFGNAAISAIAYSIKSCTVTYSRSSPIVYFTHNVCFR